MLTWLNDVDLEPRENACITFESLSKRLIILGGQSTTLEVVRLYGKEYEEPIFDCNSG